MSSEFVYNISANSTCKQASDCLIGEGNNMRAEVPEKVLERSGEVKSHPAGLTLLAIFFFLFHACPSLIDYPRVYRVQTKSPSLPYSHYFYFGR